MVGMSSSAYTRLRGADKELESSTRSWDGGRTQTRCVQVAQQLDQTWELSSPVGGTAVAKHRPPLRILALQVPMIRPLAPGAVAVTKRKRSASPPCRSGE